MMNTKSKLLTRYTGMLLSFLFLLNACQSGNKSNRIEGSQDTIQVNHKLGQTTLQLNPDRVVAMDIGALETMHELGVKAVGTPRKFIPAYLSTLKDNPDITDVGSVVEPDFEAIAALNPNLILISTRQERFYDELKDIAPTVFVGTDNKNYFESFENNVKLIGRIFQKEDLALEKLKTIEQKVKTAQDRYSQDPNKGLFLIYNNGKFSAFGKGSRFGFIHDVLQIKPLMDLDDESVHGQRVSNELVAERNPDYLFIVDRNAAVVGKKANKQDVENRLIQETNAFKNKKIFYLDPEVWFISGGGLTSVNLMLDDILKLIP
ncbi:siderophore ABC transporter substrate-binding protein [Sphingobacterium kyonggiense]|uniref:Siderophore ABC transporter substrate-binding protein n=1 Tax=Sphingobacterium kyonggiense TaxID=714075 RepID=A0ABP7YWZ7_9SPHI